MFARGCFAILVYDVLKFLDELAPISSAEDFDNVGLLVGDADANVKNVLITLDVTNNVLSAAKEKDVQLIISHHPVIFKPLKTVLKGSIIYSAIMQSVSIISMHTNLDKAGFGVSYALAEAIGLADIEVLDGTMGFGRIGNLHSYMEFADFVKYVSLRLNTPVRAVQTSKKIKRVAVVSGSGYFAVDAAIKSNADALVTGESKHNIFIESYAKDFCFLDASHFATENVVCSLLAQKLSCAFANEGVKFLTLAQKPPCCYFMGDVLWG